MRRRIRYIVKQVVVPVVIKSVFKLRAKFKLSCFAPPPLPPSIPPYNDNDQELLILIQIQWSVDAATNFDSRHTFCTRSEPAKSRSIRNLNNTASHFADHTRKKASVRRRWRNRRRSGRQLSISSWL